MNSFIFPTQLSSIISVKQKEKGEENNDGDVVYLFLQRITGKIIVF